MAAGLVATGCSSLQPVPVAFITEVHPTMVHLYNGMGVVTTVENPRLSGDTVLGTGMGGPVAVPLHEVQRVSTARFSVARTAVLISGLVAMGGLMTYVALAKGTGEENPCPEDDISVLNPLCDINR